MSVYFDMTEIISFFELLLLSLSNLVTIKTLLFFFRLEIAVPIQPLVEKLDMPEENISTFMCYLEEHEKVSKRNEYISILHIAADQVCSFLTFCTNLTIICLIYRSGSNF